MTVYDSQPESSEEGANRALRKILAFFSPRWRKPYACQSCNQPMKCGATLVGCWCSDYKLSESTRAELRKQFSRCLCRDCLEQLSRNESAKVG